MPEDGECKFDDLHEMLKDKVAPADSVESRLAALGGSAHFQSVCALALLHELEQLFAEHFAAHSLACAFLLARLLFNIERQPLAFHRADRKVLCLQRLARDWLPDTRGQLKELLRSTGTVTFALPRMRLLRLTWPQWVEQVLLKLGPLISIDVRAWAYWSRSELVANDDDSAMHPRLQRGICPQLEWADFLATRRRLNDWLRARKAADAAEKDKKAADAAEQEKKAVDPPEDPKDLKESQPVVAETPRTPSIFSQLPAALSDDAALAARIAANLKRTILNRLQVGRQLSRDAKKVQQIAYSRCVQQWADNVLHKWKATIDCEVSEYFEQYGRLKERAGDPDPETTPKSSEPTEDRLPL